MSEQENGKSANQLWKESKTTLEFLPWLEREKQKGRFLPNKVLDDITKNMRQGLGLDQAPPAPTKDKNKIMGLSKPVIIISMLLIAGAIAYNIYQKRK